jgi:hypothetical protein
MRNNRTLYISGAGKADIETAFKNKTINYISKMLDEVTSNFEA